MNIQNSNIIYIIVILVFILLLTIVYIILTRVKKYTGGKKYSNIKFNSIIKSKLNGKNTIKGILKSDAKNEDIKKSIDIKLESIPCISREVLSDMLNVIKHRHQSNPNFNAMSDDDAKFYERQAHIINNKYNLHFETTHMQLCAIRGMEMQIMIAHSKHKIESMAKTIKEDFESGFELTLIADKHKLPYILTLKQLCADFGYSQQDIKDFLRKNKPFPEKLSALNAELDSILKSDMTSSLNSNEARLRATEFENDVAKMLKDLGIKFVTEEGIKSAHNDNNGEALTTPDFLLDKGQSITLNEFPIKWIEVKNYPYYGHKFLEKGVQQQAKKYQAKYGSGVFIFKCGVICDYATIDGVKFIGWTAP
jgi:hypothetical protein